MHRTPALPRYAVHCLALVSVLSACLFLGALGDLNARTHRTAVSAHGWTLTVEYPAVAHPGLMSQLRIAVEPPADFSGPVDLAFDRQYVNQFDLALEPSPLAMASDADTVRMTFVIPLGEILLVDASARLEGNAPETLDGRVALLVADREVVALECRTAVVP
jgi:hypothetical protein